MRMFERLSESTLKLTLVGSAATLHFGEVGGTVLRQGCVLCLEGPLGAGKTTLVSGVAQGLGMPAVTQSPTFALVAEYTSGRLPLYHLDLYRLGEDAAQEMDLFDEYIYGDGVCVMEWASRIADYLPEDRLDFVLMPDVSDPEARVISIIASGKLSLEVLNEWIRKWSS